ncbi:MAG: hypothetical protein AAF653_16105, partial [Chloroflexota bacterium]
YAMQRRVDLAGQVEWKMVEDHRGKPVPEADITNMVDPLLYGFESTRPRQVTARRYKTLTYIGIHWYPEWANGEHRFKVLAKIETIHFETVFRQWINKLMKAKQKKENR